MLRLEPLDQPLDRVTLDLAGEVDRDAPVLPAVADVGRAHPFPRPLPVAHPALEVRAHLDLEPAQPRDVGVARVDAAEPHVMELRAREEKAR